MYDSREDTQLHIDRVYDLVGEAIYNLEQRREVHDASKLQEPEKSTFDRMTPQLKELVYGSDEYKAALAEMKVALDHHYEANDHHPEHYRLGIRGMSLVSIIEMLADWKAAGERHGGSLDKSLPINKDRFHIPGDLYMAMCLTALELGWLENPDAFVIE